MAELVTTTSAPATFSAPWPSKMAAPRLCQPLGDSRTLQIRAGNLIAEIQQHLGNPAHADPADAHEMNALNLGKHKNSSCRGFSG